MLSMNNYGQEYIDECRVKIDAQVAAYRELLSAATFAASDTPQLEAAIYAFEPVFFNNMLHVLDNYFVHRSRMIEKKDGNPLNEVRVLCNCLTNHNGIMTADKSIKLDPARSVLKHQFGDDIKLREPEFVLLAKAFFAEVESKYR